MNVQWPIIIEGKDVSLRPLRLRDRGAWNRIRAENRAWLAPWEATTPPLHSLEAPDLEPGGLPSYFQMIRSLNSEARSGRSFSFAIWQQERLIGQISLGGVIYGAMRAGHIGYWIDRNFANRGYTTAAVELLSEYAFSRLLLHRIEINLRPENSASRRVAQKAGYIFEGERPRYLHIDGDWRDHIAFVKENPSNK